MRGFSFALHNDSNGVQVTKMWESSREVGVGILIFKTLQQVGDQFCE